MFQFNDSPQKRTTATMIRPNRYLLSILPLLLLLLSAVGADAQTYATRAEMAGTHDRTSDSTLTQTYTGHFGWTINLPPVEVAKFNKLGSRVNEAGMTETVNFMLRGGLGGVTITYYTEKRIVPTGYYLLDSLIHFYGADSAGRNGTIHRRSYILRDQSVDIEVLLTEKGETALGGSLTALFDSFMPPEGAQFELEDWRYGRDASEYEEGDYGQGMPDRP